MKESTKRKDWNKNHENNKMYRKEAYEQFNDRKKTTWKKWISRKTQAYCIKYHKYCRYIKRKQKMGKKLNLKEWRKLKKMRKKRNKMVKGYRIEWMEKHFGIQGIEGKEGWKIAAEVRDLNNLKNKITPDFTDGKGNIIATSVEKKAELTHEYYLRNERLNKLTESIYFKQDEDFKEDDEEQKQDDIQQDEKEEEKMGEIQQEDQMEIINKENEREYNNNKPSWGKKTIDELELKFTEWMRKRNNYKWNICRRKHEIELERINASITEEEITRALVSFESGKAYGPDYVHIKFLKRTKNTTTKMLKLLYDLIYKDVKILQHSET